MQQLAAGSRVGSLLRHLTPEMRRLTLVRQRAGLQAPRHLRALATASNGETHPPETVTIGRVSATVRPPVRPELVPRAGL